MFEKFAANQLSEVLVECEIRSQDELDQIKRNVFIEVSQKLEGLIRKLSVESRER
jgi:hypothetical protein